MLLGAQEGLLARLIGMKVKIPRVTRHGVSIVSELSRLPQEPERVKN